MSIIRVLPGEMAAGDAGKAETDVAGGAAELFRPVHATAANEVERSVIVSMKRTDS